MNFDSVSAVASAVLYEGYILYPYGPNALKNRQRWTFGSIFSRDYAETTGGDPCEAQVHCLVQGDKRTVLELRARFLQIVRRQVEALQAPDIWHQVPMLEVDGTRYLSWEEAVEKDVTPPPVTLGDLTHQPYRLPFTVEAHAGRELIRGTDGSIAGALVRNAWALAGTLTIEATPLGDTLSRVTARLDNTTRLAPPARESRPLAQRRCFASAHILLGVTSGAFVSLIDPPEAFAAAAAECENHGLWPVLVGQPGARDMMLAAPIILYDYPQIASESPGDLFDATEIDEILSLRTLTLTDEEKREARATDPRAAAIIDRVEEIPREVMERLHGAVRPLRSVSPDGEDKH
jgi:hypothetical protein